MDPIRVLVVDDTAVVRRLVTDVLQEAEGIEVAGTASNGRHALQQIGLLLLQPLVQRVHAFGQRRRGALRSDGLRQYQRRP